MSSNADNPSVVKYLSAAVDHLIYIQIGFRKKTKKGTSCKRGFDGKRGTVAGERGTWKRGAIGKTGTAGKRGTTRKRGPAGTILYCKERDY